MNEMLQIADYSTSEDSDSEDSDGGEEVDSQVKKSEGNFNAKSALPSANILLASSTKKTGIVFNNPFLEAENAKTALLEKHVKMVGKDEHMKNGRKICWNNRKGRCRFGSNCHYAHDSDLSTDTPKAVTEDTKEYVKQHQYQSDMLHSADNKDHERLPVQKRKRPGLSDSIQPGKRVIKAYMQQGRTQATISGGFHKKNVN